MDRINKNII